MKVTYRYASTGGHSVWEMANVVPGGGVLSTSAYPVSYEDVECDDSQKIDVDYDMECHGWSFVEENPPPNVTKMVAQCQVTKLDTDEVVVGSTFAALLTCEFNSKGGSLLMVSASLVGSVDVAASVRVVVSGGSFGSGTVIGGQGLPELAPSSSYAQIIPLALPSTPQRTTYTVELQAASDPAGSLTIEATNPATAAASLSVVEYA